MVIDRVRTSLYVKQNKTHTHRRQAGVRPGCGLVSGEWLVMKVLEYHGTHVRTYVLGLLEQVRATETSRSKKSGEMCSSEAGTKTSKQLTINITPATAETPFVESQVGRSIIVTARRRCGTAAQSGRHHRRSCPRSSQTAACRWRSCATCQNRC